MILLAPVLIELAPNVGVAPSKLLIQLSFAAIRGGAMTLVGNSTNILMSPWRRGRAAAHNHARDGAAGVATFGDYRHWVEVPGRRLSHTMDPRRGAPLFTSPASVRVVARTCAEADAWATALMVLGPEKGAALARQSGLDALFLLRDDDASARGVGVGRLFSEEPAAIASAERR